VVVEFVWEFLARNSSHYYGNMMKDLFLQMFTRFVLTVTKELMR